MPVESAADIAGMFNADEFGVTATWRARGDGAPVSVVVIRDRPDEIAGGFSTSLISATDVLTMPAGAIAPAAGDTFTIGAEVLTAHHTELDMTGATWRVSCRRDA